MEDWEKIEIESIQKWLTPTRLKLLKISAIERVCNIPKTAFYDFLNYGKRNRRSFPIHQLPKLITTLELFGYKSALDKDLIIIRNSICNYFKISVKIFLKNTTKHKTTIPRQIAMYFAILLTRHSPENIGKVYGGKDRGTVNYAYYKIAGEMETDKKFAIKIKEIENRLKSKFQLLNQQD